MSEIREWLASRSENLRVNVEKVDFSYNGFWYYDSEDGFIRNKKNSFFQLAGYQEIEDDHIIGEQPMIIQNEIGYLGILCKMINGTLNFLMQAKIEPGNVNVIQISPTLQATKSNFTRMHGGQAPRYLDYFVDSGEYHVVVDQLQSEQSSRFYKKRNRNIIIYTEAEVPVYESHKWMTLGQIKELMRQDNIVNMDTRTVLSCIPCVSEEIKGKEDEVSAFCGDTSLIRSIFKPVDHDQIHRVFNIMNDHKMYRRENSRLLPIKSMKGWKMTDREIVCKTPYDFKVIYCRIEIEGREVKYWEQPLIEALGTAIFGIFTCVEDGVRKYLVRVREEMGCFDSAELGPVVQLEPTNTRNRIDEIERFFLDRMERQNGIVTDVMLSEEGGRFYHEQNRNVIINIRREELPPLPQGYFWMDYATISCMIQFNNCVNIQLRNLISLIDLS